MPPAAGGPDVFELQGRRMTRVGMKLVDENGTLAGAAITMRDAVRYVADDPRPAARRRADDGDADARRACSASTTASAASRPAAAPTSSI